MDVPGTFGETLDPQMVLVLILLFCGLFGFNIGWTVRVVGSAFKGHYTGEMLFATALFWAVWIGFGLWLFGVPIVAATK